MPTARRTAFANDNHPLHAGDRDAIQIALGLPDAQTLRKALREKLAAVRLRSRPRPAYKASLRPSGPSKPGKIVGVAALVMVSQDVARP